MTLVHGLLDTKKFTKLAIQNMYGNWRVAKENKDKLAVVCQARNFSLLTISFGPTEAPEYFQYFIHEILLSRMGKETAANPDNIWLTKRSCGQHSLNSD